jgi:hypothetical protein
MRANSILCFEWEVTSTSTSSLRSKSPHLQWSSIFSWSHHIRTIADKFSEAPDVMIAPHRSKVRTVRKYCSPLLSQTNKSQELRNVQKAFIAPISGTKGISYWDHLKKFSLISPKRRRERYIITYGWKIYHFMTTNDLNIELVSSPQLGNLFRVP